MSVLNDDNDNEFIFGEPWHKENLPTFPLEEGESYLVPLKLLKKERVFDGGRGTEFYLFGDEERLGRYISFADYNLPKGLKQIINEKSERADRKKLEKSIGKKFGKIRTSGSAALWNFFLHPSTPVTFSNAALLAQIFPWGRRANSCLSIS